MNERRRYIRAWARMHGLERGRLRPGHLVEIRDVSSVGVAFETSYRVLPGRIIEVLVTHGATPHSMRGRVVRCAVRMVTATRVCYIAAVAFEHPQTWIEALQPLDGSLASALETHAGVDKPSRAGSTSRP